jgi:thiol-disulfide isomerase/thioredoxin
VKRNIVYLLVVVVAITVLLIAGKRASKGNGGQLAAGRAVGQIAPDFELKVLGGNGKTMKLSDLRGKAVLIDFWATYCGPCKIEMPWIADLQKKYGPQGFQVVGIDIGDAASEKQIADFAQKLGVNYPILMGTDEVGDRYFGGVSGLPQNFFVDRSGKIVGYELGVPPSASVFEEHVKTALGESGTTNKTASLQ